MKRFLQALALWLSSTVGAPGQTAAAVPAAVPKRRSSRLPLAALLLAALLALGGQASAQVTKTFVFGTGSTTITGNHAKWTENGNTLDIDMTNADIPPSGYTKFDNGTSAWKVSSSQVDKKTISVTFTLPGY